MTRNSFDVDPDASEPLRTRAPRSSVFLRATLEHFGGIAPTQHRVRDLSTGGMCIDQALGLTAGATVLVTVGALQAVGSTIAWVKGSVAGVKFAHPIDVVDAKTKAAIPARATAVQSVDGHELTAGWMADRSNPYRK